MTAGRHCQTPACVLARPKGRAKAIRWLKPLDCKNDPKPGGHGSPTVTMPPLSTAARSTPGLRIWVLVTGGMLRVPAGLAVGVEPASDPVKRIMVNVETPRARRAAGGGSGRLDVG